jgi:hypothetical protein
MVSNFRRAAASFLGAAFWWFVDKMWGDRVFAALKPHLPEWHIWTMSLDEWLRLAFAYGPLAVLVALGVFFLRESRRKSDGPITADQSEKTNASVKAGDKSVVIGVQHSAGPISNLINPTFQYGVSPVEAPSVAKRRPYNWTIRQAYQYRISLMERPPTGEEMNKIFKEFRQEAIDGAFVIRGIPLMHSPILELDQPHETIPPAHWRTMDFYSMVYTLDASDEEAYRYATEPDGFGKPIQPFWGLMVSEAQVKELWPRPVEEVTSSFRPIHEVIAHVAAKLGEPPSNTFFPTSRRAIRQQALDGKLKLRGRIQIDDLRQPNSLVHREVHENIPQDYWANATFNVISSEPTAADHYHTFPENSAAWDIGGQKDKRHYASILADWNDVLKLWPS